MWKNEISDLFIVQFQDLSIPLTKKYITAMIDIHILPLKAQNELIDFYQFLVERYVSGKKKKQFLMNSNSKQVNTFFDQYNIDLSDFNFNRSELYDR